MYLDLNSRPKEVADEIARLQGLGARIESRNALRDEILQQMDQAGFDLEDFGWIENAIDEEEEEESDVAPVAPTRKVASGTAKKRDHKDRPRVWELVLKTDPTKGIMKTGRVAEYAMTNGSKDLTLVREPTEAETAAMESARQAWDLANPGKL